MTMNLTCARCIESGMAPPAFGTEPLRARGPARAKPAVTVTGGEALCAEHLADSDAR